MSCRYSTTFLIIIMVVFLGLSCSGGGLSPGGLNTPTSPGLTENKQQEAESSNHYLWSFSNVLVDPEEMKLQLVPLRQTGAHWNVLKFLEQGPCLNCVKLLGSVPSGNGTLLVDVEIKHPFTNPDITGFDVRGIVMFNGSHSFPAAGLNASDRSLGDGELVNADGYTTLYNPDTIGSGPSGLQGYLKGKFASASYPNAHLNGYIRHISPGAVNTRSAFYAGDSILETYEIAMPSGPFIFGYAVDACWAPPIHKPVVDPMSDFPPEANCYEPWKIAVNEHPVSQGLTDLGGSTELLIDVYDWSGMSSHHAPVIECPELFDSTVTAEWQSDGSGFSTYEATVSNDELAIPGKYRCLVSVEDNENGSSSEWLNLTAYQILSLEVVPFANSLPVPQAKAVPNPQTVCEEVQLEDDGSYDPDGGLITKCEWDWDNDGTYDEEGTSVSHTWNQVGSFQVGFRVTDDEGATNEIELTVEVENALPTAVAQADYGDVPVGENVHFTSVGSQDNDCGDASITLYEWDFNYDGGFDAEAEGASVDHAFSGEGNYEVMLRVTDDEGGYGFLDVPLMIHAYEGLPPVARAEAKPSWQTECNAITFQDDGSYDPDGGLIVKYEWDWNNDGVFDDEGKTVEHSWGNKCTCYVQFRVTDDEGATSVLDQPLEIQVLDMFPTADAVAWPVPAFVGADVNFDGSNSYDGLCGTDTIVLWGWDWDYDSVIDQFGETVTHSWDTKGTYPVQLKVKDDEESYAMTTQPLQIDVFAGWARTWGGTTGSTCTEVCTDGSGSIYAAGNFAGSVDFDPGPGEHILSAVGNTDAYLSKYDPNGNFLWAVSWGSSSYEYALALASYGDSIYVTGYYSGTIDLDPSPDATDLRYCAGLEDVFVSKFNSSGAYQWGKTWGGTGSDAGTGIIVGNAEAFVEVVGDFQNTVSFDPAGDDHTSNGGYDCFLTKLIPSGGYVTTQTWGGTDNDKARAITVDKDNNTYVTGSFMSTVDFNPFSPVYSKTSNGDTDVFLTERNSNGDYVWTLTWGGSSSDSGSSLAGGKLFPEVWITGDFMGTVDFDPGAGIDSRTSNGLSDIFLSDFSSSGQRYFTDTWGGTDWDFSYGIAYRNDDKVFVTGEFKDQVDFDPGAGSQIRTTNGGYDVFLSTFAYPGVLQWVQTWGGTTNDIGQGVACLDTEPKPIYVGGLFTDTVDFNPGPGIDEQTAPGSKYDAFISRFPTDGQW